MKPQIKELLTQYLSIDVLWFDGEWIADWTDERGRDLYNYVRAIRPSLIVNNRVGHSRQGLSGLNKEGHVDLGDFGTPEQQVDRKSTRLNSSHLVISYAVFCLKKKIILNAPQKVTL